MKYKFEYKQKQFEGGLSEKHTSKLATQFWQQNQLILTVIGY